MKVNCDYEIETYSGTAFTLQRRRSQRRKTAIALTYRTSLPHKTPIQLDFPWKFADLLLILGGKRSDFRRFLTYRLCPSAGGGMGENTELGAIKKLGDNGVELVKSFADKHADLLRPAARYFSALKGAVTHGKGRYTLAKNVEDTEPYEKPLPCYGCGIGWFSFLLGFVCPFLWYYATFLYFGNYYKKDPRERAGLAASAITAMGFTLLLLVIAAFLLL